MGPSILKCTRHTYVKYDFVRAFHFRLEYCGLLALLIAKPGEREKGRKDEGRSRCLTQEKSQLFMSVYGRHATNVLIASKFLFGF